jgi:hypothetical protein
MKKYGIIQLRGAGDVIIGLPIAKHIYNLGHEVYWVIDKHFYKAFQNAAPYINFIPLEPEGVIHGNIFNEFWHEAPTRLLKNAGCDEIISFPFEECRFGSQINLENRFDNEYARKARQLDLSSFLTFDQFKYAVAGVPFREKWNLDIRRNLNREKDLFEEVVGDKQNYCVVHNEAAMGTFKCEITDTGFFESTFGKGVHPIKIEPITDSVFDWLTIIERSSGFIGLDSFFVNLIEQLEIPIRKIFLRRSPVFFTPILRNEWEYLPLYFKVAETLTYEKK